MKHLRVVCWTLLLVLLGVTLTTGWYTLQHLLRKHRPISRRGFPTGIVIHHTATPPFVGRHLIDAAAIDVMHARRGFGLTSQRDGQVYHIGYHFVILQDGTVQKGRPEYLPGAHAKGYPTTLGIVLVGNFQRSSNGGRQGPLTPPPAQLAAAVRLTRALMAKYDLPPAQVYLHRDLRATACPGDGFPRKRFFQEIAQPLAEQQRGRR